MAANLFVVFAGNGEGASLSERPTFRLLKTAPSVLKTAPGNVKVGLRDFCDCRWYTGNHRQRAGSAFYIFTLLLFYLSKSPLYFLTFLLLCPLATTPSPRVSKIIAATKIIGEAYAFLYINYYLCMDSSSVGCQTNHIHHHHNYGYRYYH